MQEITVENLENSEKHQEQNKTHPPTHSLGDFSLGVGGAGSRHREGNSLASDSPEARSLGTGRPLGFGGRKGACLEPSPSLPRCPTADLGPSAHGVADRSTPATGCGGLAAMPTIWPVLPASRASASCPRARNLAWLRRRCCAESTTTP